MPSVNPETGQPVSDDPDQEDQSLAGGTGRGDNVDANSGPAKHSSIEMGPDNQRESQPGAVSGDAGDDPGGDNATGGV